MLQEIKLPIDEIRARFKESYSGKLIRSGVAQVKAGHLVANLLRVIPFPSFEIVASAASASEISGHPGRVSITIPLRSSADTAEEILISTNISTDHQKRHLSFATEADSCEAAAQKAHEIMQKLQALSAGITEDIEEFRASFPKYVSDNINAEEQRERDRLQRNADLTNILRGK